MLSKKSSKKVAAKWTFILLCMKKYIAIKHGKLTQHTRKWITTAVHMNNASNLNQSAQGYVLGLTQR